MTESLDVFVSQTQDLLASLQTNQTLKVQKSALAAGHWNATERQIRKAGCPLA